VRYLFIIALIFLSLQVTALARPVVMLTGYWHPTSEMLAPFSDDPDLNPDGWIGENWEGLGYDVYAFFPAFDKRSREFEVDYQATWRDFWDRADEFHPEIIISFGATTGSPTWLIEDDAFNWDTWYPDEQYPYYPTPNPPDDTMSANAARYSTLPMEAIRDAVNAESTIGDLEAVINENGNPGWYLCNYIAYLGMWYQGIHSRPDDEFFCEAAGFIHVTDTVSMRDAKTAVDVTLRTTLEHFGDVTPVGDQVAAAVTARIANYPNPFNPQTNIACTIPASGRARLQVVDLKGRLVASLFDEVVAAGQRNVIWNGRDSGGFAVPSGVYFSRLETGGQVTHGRMTLVR